MAKVKKEKITKNREAIRLPIFLPFAGCPFRCIYCQQNTITAQTGLSCPNEVAEMVKKFVNYRSGKKKEVAFFGGTFTALPMALQEKYLQAVESFLEKGDTIRLSTRPDCLSAEILKLLQKYKVQTVELGVQSFSDKVLLTSGRGYLADQAVEAVKQLQAAEFRVTVQVMPFLPAEDAESLQKTLQTIIQLQPEEVRIYPTVVLAETELEKLYRKGEYSPVSLKRAVQVCSKWKRDLEERGIKVIKIGLHSDVAIDPKKIIAGAYHPAFGELVKIENLYEKIVQENPHSLQKLRVDPDKISLYRGHGKLLLKKLKDKYGAVELCGAKKC